MWSQDVTGLSNGKNMQKYLEPLLQRKSCWVLKGPPPAAKCRQPHPAKANQQRVHPPATSLLLLESLWLLKSSDLEVYGIWIFPHVLISYFMLFHPSSNTRCFQCALPKKGVAFPLRWWRVDQGLDLFGFLLSTWGASYDKDLPLRTLGWPICWGIIEKMIIDS